jgi:hypothetical protein
MVRDVIEAYFKKYHPDILNAAIKKGEKKIVAPVVGGEE